MGAVRKHTKSLLKYLLEQDVSIGYVWEAV